MASINIIEKLSFHLLYTYFNKNSDSTQRRFPFGIILGRSSHYLSFALPSQPSVYSFA